MRGHIKSQQTEKTSTGKFLHLIKSISMWWFNAHMQCVVIGQHRTVPYYSINLYILKIENLLPGVPPPCPCWHWFCYCHECVPVLFSISLPDWFKFLSWPLAPRPLSGTFCVAWHTFQVCPLATTISDHSEWAPSVSVLLADTLRNHREGCTAHSASRKSHFNVPYFVSC